MVRLPTLQSAIVLKCGIPNMTQYFYKSTVKEKLFFVVSRYFVFKNTCRNQILIIKSD